MITVFLDSEKPMKSSIMGNLFVALSEGHISPSQFNDALLVVISSSVVALNGLNEWYKATGGQSYGFSSDDGTPEQKTLPFLMSLGVALHRGDEIFLNEIGENIYKYGIKIS